MDQQSQDYLEKFLESLSYSKRKQYQSFSSDYFCNDELNANLCAELIRSGEKTATCSLKYWYDSGTEPMPIVGHLQVVTNWSGKPVCIIEIVLVSQCQYSDVTEEFAQLEGEGDRSLKWWKKAHWDFFTQECKSLNIQPTETMMLLLEQFHVVYKS